MRYIKTIIDEIDVKENIRTEQQILNIEAGLFKLMNNMKNLYEKIGDDLPRKERKQMAEGIKEMQDYFIADENKC